MPEPIYLDTNPLVYWAKARAGSTDGREQQCGANLQAIVDGDDPLGCSPITLAEFVGALAKTARSGAADLAYFDTTKLQSAVTEVMGLMASGRLRVINLHPRAFEVGMSVVAAGIREHGEAFFAWDAIHLFEACQWARVMEREVVLATSDRDFTTILDVFPEFGRYVNLRDLAI
jgi:hypothetical protein